MATIIFFIFNVAAFNLRCGEAEKAKKAAMAKTISLKKGEVYKIDVDNLGGAGYQWILEENDSAITNVEIQSSERPNPKSAVGAAVKQTISIKGLNPGSSTIKVVQKRIWENAPPFKEVQIKVNVQ